MMNNEISLSAATQPTFLQQLLATLNEGARTSLGFRPRWERISASPALIALLFVLLYLLLIGLERLTIVGEADFYWRAFLQMGAVNFSLIWLAYYLRSSRSEQPTSAQLITAVWAQDFFLMLLISLPGIAYLHAPADIQKHLTSEGPLNYLWFLPMAWMYAVQLLLLWRASSNQKAKFSAVAIIYISAVALMYYANPAHFWYATERNDTKPERASLVLDQATMEAQPALLAQKLSTIQAERAGVVDLFSIEFAPYADEDVFLHEATMVSQVMSSRFGTAGRDLQLINHVNTLKQWPWATPTNLQRSITAIAQKMNPNEDILFMHLTSHGAKNGRLAASFWPMDVDELTPVQLKSWLKQAGVKYSVISISACFSGSWIAPLADENTLVMTAADANHTSYGCGSRSALTFFGRAMYDEQLKNQTYSFVKAHAAARKIIQQREVEAGKDDGYSNPQISVGSAIGQPLAQLEARLNNNKNCKAISAKAHCESM